MPKAIDRLKQRRARQAELLKEINQQDDDRLTERDIKSIEEKNRKIREAATRNFRQPKDDELGSPPGSENYEKMYNQPESEGGDPAPVKRKHGGMGSCPNRPDGIRGGGAAIAGMKFQGVK